MGKMLSYEQAEHKSLLNIKVIGIGGGGINAVNHMIDYGMHNVEFIAVSTVSYGLQLSKAHTQILIGENRPVGLGTLPMPACRVIAEEAKDIFKKHLCGSDIVFIVACMGGNTGTGAASVVASCARELGALTIAVVTKPFRFEGLKRRKNAHTGICELNKNADTIITISNDCLLPIIKKNTPLVDVFHTVDDTIRRCIQSISDTFNTSSQVKVEFTDIKLLLSNAGSAKMSFGSAQGENGAENAAKMAIENPLLENALKDGTGVLLSIRCGENTDFMDKTAILDVFSKLTMSDTKYVWSVIVDNKLAKGEIEVNTIVLNPIFANEADKEYELMESTDKQRGFDDKNESIILPEWLRRLKSENKQETPETLAPRPDGKKVCAYLRNIRMELAHANNIPYTSEPCSFTGSCAGTCPKCDQEAAYLRDELNKIPKQNRKYPQHILSDWENAVCLEK